LLGAAFCIVVLNVIMLDATRLTVMASPISFKILPPDFYEPIPVFFVFLKVFFTNTYESNQSQIETELIIYFF